jgi:hypothetical protein
MVHNTEHIGSDAQGRACVGSGPGLQRKERTPTDMVERSAVQAARAAMTPGVIRDGDGRYVFDMSTASRIDADRKTPLHAAAGGAVIDGRASRSAPCTCRVAPADRPPYHLDESSSPMRAHPADQGEAGGVWTTPWRSAHRPAALIYVPGGVAHCAYADRHRMQAASRGMLAWISLAVSESAPIACALNTSASSVDSENGRHALSGLSGLLHGGE